MRELFVAVTVALASLGFCQELRSVPVRYAHQLFLPKKAWASGKRWPMILYLHGRSLRGNDLAKLGTYGLPKRLKTDKGFPFIVVSPQLPDGQRWTDTRALASLVEETASELPVDRSRIYAMGFSMGASGVWRVAHDRPDLFAAIVSIAGSYEKPIAASGRLKRVPVWMLHGTADKDAPYAAARETFLVHRGAGGTGHFTSFEGQGHGLTHLFDRSDLYQWLLRHQRR